MKIAYRRMSGKVGLSQFEEGTRGMWWEKRKALLAALRSRGHVVEIVSPLTKYSGDSCQAYGPEHELLMIEFGSSNTNFYGKALAETADMFERHKGPIVFLCDDPDLPFHAWGTKRRPNTFQWLNCLTPQPLKSPDWVVNLDMPFSSLQVPKMETRVSIPTDAPLVYIGRPGGRAKAIGSLLAANVQFVAYANPKEWEGFDVEVRTPPTQVERAAFYAQQLGCLALADSKHKRFGWRTGRAYHAALAGCPVLGESDHPGVTSSFACFSKPNEVNAIVDSFRRWRESIVNTQLDFIARDRAIAEETFARCGI